MMEIVEGYFVVFESGVTARIYHCTIDFNQLST